MLVKSDLVYLKLIEKARVARLATVDTRALPHVVPVVFVFDGKCFFIPLDNKSKKVKPDKLRRIKNIQTNPHVALLIDEYNEDWTKLLFIIIRGRATIINKADGRLLQKVQRLLLSKYIQYKEIGIGKLCIKIDPYKVIFWKNE